MIEKNISVIANKNMGKPVLMHYDISMFHLRHYETTSNIEISQYINTGLIML